MRAPEWSLPEYLHGYIESVQPTNPFPYVKVRPQQAASGSGSGGRSGGSRGDNTGGNDAKNTNEGAIDSGNGRTVIGGADRRHVTDGGRGVGCGGRAESGRPASRPDGGLGLQCEHRHAAVNHA